MYKNGLVPTWRLSPDVVQVKEAAAEAGVEVGGENALPCFSHLHIDAAGLDRIVYNTQAWGPPLQVFREDIVSLLLLPKFVDQPSALHCQGCDRQQRNVTLAKIACLWQNYREIAESSEMQSVSSRQVHVSSRSRGGSL